MVRLVVLSVGIILVGDSARANEPRNVRRPSIRSAQPVSVHPEFGMFMNCLAALTPPVPLSDEAPNAKTRIVEWAKYFQPRDGQISSRQSFSPATTFMAPCPSGRNERPSACLFTFVAPGSCYYGANIAMRTNNTPYRVLAPLGSNRGGTGPQTRVAMTLYQDASAASRGIFSAVDTTIQSGPDSTARDADAIMGNTCGMSNAGGFRALMSIRNSIARLRDEVDAIPQGSPFTAAHLLPVLVANAGCADLRSRCRVGTDADGNLRDRAPDRDFVESFREDGESSTIPSESLRFSVLLREICGEMRFLTSVAARAVTGNARLMQAVQNRYETAPAR